MCGKEATVMSIGLVCLTIAACTLFVTARGCNQHRYELEAEVQQQYIDAIREGQQPVVVSPPGISP